VGAAWLKTLRLSFSTDTCSWNQWWYATGTRGSWN